MVERIQDLSARMAAGDADAVEAFYRHYFDWMYSQARRATKRDEAFCLDVVQDAVLRVIRAVKAVESEPRFLGWLRLVVQTTAFDLLRSEKRRKNREAMAGTSPVDVDSDSLQLDWLQEQISQLDPELVKIIELRFGQSWTLRRIGESLGVSVGAIDGRLRRALKDIRLSAKAESVELEPTKHAEGPSSRFEKIVSPSAVETLEVVADQMTILEEALQPASVVEQPTVNVIAAPMVFVETIAEIARPAAVSIPVTNIIKIAPAARAIVEQIVLAPVMAVEVTSVPVDALELIGLDDEAGAYDDRL